MRDVISMGSIELFERETQGVYFTFERGYSTTDTLLFYTICTDEMQLEEMRLFSHAITLSLRISLSNLIHWKKKHIKNIISTIY